MFAVAFVSTMLRGACGRITDEQINNFFSAVNPDEGMNESYQMYMAFLVCNARSLATQLGRAPTAVETDAHLYAMAERRPLFYLVLTCGRCIEALLASQNAVRFNDFDSSFELRPLHQIVYLLDHGYK